METVIVIIYLIIVGLLAWRIQKQIVKDVFYQWIGAVLMAMCVVDVVVKLLVWALT